MLRSGFGLRGRLSSTWTKQKCYEKQM